jgi:hypothetical protein
VSLARLLLVMTLAVAASARAADHSLEMHVSPTVALAPSDVMIDMTVERRESNHRLDVMLDSDGYFRSSSIDLDGERSARVISVRFRQVPAGRYEVRVELLNGEGQAVAFASTWISLT